MDKNGDNKLTNAEIEENIPSNEPQETSENWYHTNKYKCKISIIFIRLFRSLLNW